MRVSVSKDRKWQRFPRPGRRAQTHAEPRPIRAPPRRAPRQTCELSSTHTCAPFLHKSREKRSRQPVPTLSPKYGPQSSRRKQGSCTTRTHAHTCTVHTCTQGHTLTETQYTHALSCTHIHTHAHMLTEIHTVHTHAPTHIHTCSQRYTQYTPAHTHLHTCIHTQTCTRICTHAHRDTHVHVRTHTQVNGLKVQAGLPTTVLSGSRAEQKYLVSGTPTLHLFNSFIEMSFTHWTIHPLKAYNSMGFSLFTRLSNHHHSRF